MAMLIGPISMTQVGDIVKLQFNSYKDAQRFFNDNCVTPRPRIESELSAPALFHIERGCCDGTDPVACNKRREAADTIARNEAREAARQERERNRRNEYEGTEPSGDLGKWHQLICRHPDASLPHRMGDKCPDCGFVF